MNRSGSQPDRWKSANNCFNRFDPPQGFPAGSGGVYHFWGYGGL